MYMQDLAVVALIKATKATGVEFLHCNAHEAAQPSISCSSKSSRQSRMTQRCRCHCNGSLGKPQSIPLTVVLVQQYKASLSQHVSHPAERAHLLYMFNTTSLPSPLSKLKSWIFRMTMFLSHKPSILFISFKKFQFISFNGIWIFIACPNTCVLLFTPAPCRKVPRAHFMRLELMTLGSTA